MRLQDRNLSLRMQGADVALLQSELRQLKFSINDRDGFFGKATRQAVLEFQRRHGLEATGVVDQATAAEINTEVDALQPEPEPVTERQPFVVHGVVRNADGSPFTGGTIRAYDKDLRTEELLGEAAPANGRYEISYPADKFSRAEKKSADLFIRVTSTDGSPQESPILFNAPPVATIDLVLGNGRLREPSEYERYLQVITPLVQHIRVRGIPTPTVPQQLADLQQDDIAFLANETRIEAVHLVFLSLAAKFEIKTEHPPELFYGLFREGFPTRLPALLLEPGKREALEHAIGANIIPPFARMLDALLESLQKLAARFVTDPVENDGFVLGELVALSDIPSDIQARLLTFCVEHEGNNQELWNALQENADFQQAGVLDKFRFVMQLGFLTDNNVPLVQVLEQKRRSGTFQTFRELTALDEAAWQELVAATKQDDVTPLPPDVPGETQEKKIANYIHNMIELLKDIFPTTYVGIGIAQQPALDAQLVKQVMQLNPDFDPAESLPDDLNWGEIAGAERERAKESLTTLRREVRMFPGLDYKFFLDATENRNPVRTELARFFGNVPEFDLRETHIETFLHAEHARAFAGIEDQQGVTTQLKRLQRVIRLAPRYEHAQALLGERLDSAFAITSVPLPNFVALLGDRLGGEMQTKAYYYKSQQTGALLLNMTANIYQSMYDAAPKSVGKVTKDALKKMPTWAELFGSLDLCDCEHCRSVYSPAAYFVDLLQFLRKSSGTPFNVLMGRRPDLQHIQLNCENTQTPLPYVDLVNEILESYVALGIGKLDATTAKNTSGMTADELSVNPQYMEEDAYAKLKDAVFSFQLPFNRPVQVARSYLEHLGSSRYQVMAFCQNKGDPNNKIPSDLDLACEYLKITTEERMILTGLAPNPVREFFGYKKDSIPAEDEEGNDIIEAWDENLTRVPEFLRRTGVDYPDVVELLKTRFINSDQTSEPLPANTIVLFAPNSTCDLSQTRIEHLDGTPLAASEWLRLHRFLRLWRKLGWELQELDKTIQALGAAEIDDTLLQNLAHLVWLRAELNLPVAKLLSLWAPLDTFGGDALYQKLFLNKAVIHPVDEAFALDPDDPTQLADNNAKLSEHVPAILAALRINADDLATLRDATGLADPSDVAFVGMTLENLSLLYRHALLAKALSLKVKELLGLMALAGLDPKQALTLLTTVELVKVAQKVRRAGFSVAQLNYLYRHVTEPPKSLAPLPETVSLLLQELQRNLKSVIEETTVAADPTGDLLHSKLGMLLDSTLVDTAMDLILGKSALTDTERENFVELHFQSFLDTNEAKGVLLGNTNLTAEERAAANMAYVLPRLMSYLRDTLSRSLVKQTLSEALQLDGAMTQLLLEKVLKAQIDPAKPSIADFLALVGDGLEATYFADANLNNAQLTRIDAAINFDWGEGAPTDGINPASFSARWTGRVLVEHDETYTFYTRVKDGARLWVDNQLVVDQWQAQAEPVEHSSPPIALKAGQFYELKLEFFKSGVSAVAELRWSSLSTSKTVVQQSQLYSGTTFIPLEGLLKSYYRLHKVALLVNRFAMQPAEAVYFSAHAADWGGFDLNGLPLDRSDPATTDAQALALFAQWLQLEEFFALRDKLPQGEMTLLNVFGAASLGEAYSGFASMTGWALSDIEYLAGEGGLNLTAAELKNALGPARLADAFGLSRRTGVSVQLLHAWAVSQPTAEQAKNIIQTVKAKFDDAAWLNTAKALNDELREKQKAALIAYVLADESIVAKNIVDSKQLFEYFLIDVDMGACMMTSRIKQAISSVQLFTQRCLMNLEVAVAPSLIDAEQWKWMKSYRLWEANRKVWLYPENWIEWELRDDKTPFYKEFEAQLLQDELTEENVEQGLRAYLRKLDDVANLELCGMWWEKASTGTSLGGRGAGRFSAGTKEVFHVFGRTMNPPCRYYYRRYYVDQKKWTPWELVNLDIEGEHLIPVLFHDRLYLYWPIFAERASSENNPPPPEGQASLPTKYWEIKMAWSEYNQDHWGPKQLSVGFVPHPSRIVQQGGSHYESTPRDFTFSVAFPQQILNINVHKTYQAGEKTNWASVYGIFWMDDCRGKMYTYVPPSNAITTIYFREPKNSFMEYMVFTQDQDAPGGLTIDTSPPEADDVVHSILKATPTHFQILHPHQLNNGLGVIDGEGYYALYRSLYPFFYRDLPRSYFVQLVTDYPPVSRVVVTNPLITKKMSAQDSLVYQFTSAGWNQAASKGLETTSFNTAQFQNGLHYGPMQQSLGFASQPKIVEPASPGESELQPLLSGSYVLVQTAKLLRYLKFHTLFHPHICALVSALNTKGVSDLLTLDNQKRTNDLSKKTRFQEEYQPTSEVHWDYPKENVDFKDGAYSQYNWELFFYVPLLIAGRLSQDQRFELAQKWFHYVFDPTDSAITAPSPNRYWKLLPFHENTESGRIEDLMETLSSDEPGQQAKRNVLESRIAEWRENPFNPHLIARSRMMAYQKTVVMKYIENLIGWGDQLFRRDTIETINEATMLYIMASNILGARPEQIPSRGKVEVKTYSEIKGQLDSFSNILVQLENELPFSSENNVYADGNGSGGNGGLGFGTTFYFCIPQNEKLLSYWDTVEDRLFKIRRCMNIEGVVRALPLFEPPIDPALLVRATAMGLDLSSILNDVNSPLPHYRFSYLVQKAMDLCGEVKALGAGLLSALEKKDAEALALLHASHETSMLKAIREVKEQQLLEATSSVLALQKTRELTDERRRFYERNLKTPLNSAEKTQLAKLKAANDKMRAATSFEMEAKVASAMPDLTAGSSGTMASPVATAQFGGSLVATGLQAYAEHLKGQAADATYEATQSSLMGAHLRRTDEYTLQLALASKELEQIDKQIAAAEIRAAIAEKEIENHDRQIENGAAVEDFLQNKYTRQELYSWMLSQGSSVFFQSYKLAYDLAKRAEKAYRFERGLGASNFIQFGYWDTLRKGLLSGERLALDLKRMELAYLDQNKREYELTKHISLLLHDPMALLTLRETGRCEFELPESVFTKDYLSHYMRRIKSVSLTIPCVTGPFTSINCTLTLLSSKIRMDNNAQMPYLEQAEDPRFITNFGAVESIAMSHAQNDSGVFELNFSDERYLPFEGAGVISRWRIDLRRDCNAWDFDTISDVVLNMNLSAREGGELLGEKARAEVIMPLPQNLARLFSAKHDFPSEWHRFLHPVDSATIQTLPLALTPERFPFPLRDSSIEISDVELFLKLKSGIEYPGSGQALALSLTPAEGIAVSLALESADSYMNGVPHGVFDVSSDAKGFGTWTIAADEQDIVQLAPALRQVVTVDGVTHHHLKAEALQDMLILPHYSVTG